MAFDLRNELFAKIQSLSFSYHDQHQTGQLMTRVTSDVEGVRLFYASEHPWTSEGAARVQLGSRAMGEHVYHPAGPHAPQALVDEPAPGVDTVAWSGETFATDPDANALRWGTMYNFWFDADAGPDQIAMHRLELFKPGMPAAIASPMKFAKPGRPQPAMATMRKAEPTKGIRCRSPPILSMSSVPVSWWMWPEIANESAASNPCAIMIITAPVTPTRLRLAMPRNTKPMCATLELPMSRFRSRCRIATRSGLNAAVSRFARLFDSTSCR